MQLAQVFDVACLRQSNLSSANWTLFVFGHLKDNVDPKIIPFHNSSHKPISEQTNQVESVKTLIHSHQVCPVGKLLIGKSGLVFAKVFQADRASASNSIVIN
jgi:hypothetical protein